MRPTNTAKYVRRLSTGGTLDNQKLQRIDDNPFIKEDGILPPPSKRVSRSNINNFDKKRRRRHANKIKRPKLRKLKREKQNEEDERKQSELNNDNNSDGRIECSPDNALRLINLSHLSVSDLSEWIKTLPTYKKLEHGQCSDKDIEICNALSTWIYEQGLNGKHIGNQETFKYKEFEEMMKCLKTKNNENYNKYEWIWNIIKECQKCKDENFTSLGWINSSWKRFVLINEVKIEECDQIEIREVNDSKSDLSEDDLKESVFVEIAQNENDDKRKKNVDEMDEFLWRRNAELLFMKLQKIENDTKIAQRNVTKLQSKLANKTFQVRFLENEIQSRWTNMQS